MLRGVLISPDCRFRIELAEFLNQSGRVLLLREFSEYPSLDDALSVIRAHDPQVLFIDVEPAEAALALIRGLRDAGVDFLTVAVSQTVDSRLLLDLMNAGIREFMSPPYDPEAFHRSIDRVSEMVRSGSRPRAVSGRIHAFLPAKPGDGASLTAVNTALATARSAGDGVLLADLDLNVGMSAFHLNLAHRHAMRQALTHAGELDDDLWSDIVARVGPLDVLPSGPIEPMPTAAGERVSRLLEWLRARYGQVCVDLSGSMEDFNLNVFHAARRIVLVCTPTVASVYHAREKLQFLRREELEDRVAIVLNRWSKGAAMTMQSIEELLGLPIQYRLPDEAAVVHKSLMSGTPVESSSALGRSFTQLAASLAEISCAEEEAAWKSRVEQFALVPVKYYLFAAKK